MNRWVRRLRRVAVRLWWALEALYAAARGCGTPTDPILMDAECQAWIAQQEERAL